MRILTTPRQKASVSFRVANTTSLAHNNRENVHGNPDIDVERIKDNVTYIREHIEAVYKREFEQAVAEYNSNQKRADRKINDYYKKILSDKKTHHQREIIVAIGKKDDGIDWIYKKNILDKYARDFQNDNPNLIVYNSVLHMDEANPHLHINYIPIYTVSRGLKKRVGHDKAIEQQNYKDFNEWQAEQREILEDLMIHYRLEREYVGTHDYFSVPEYKNLRETVKRLENAKKDLNNEIQHRQQQLDELPKLKAINVEVETRPNKFNQSEIVVKKNDFENIQKLAKLAKAQSDKCVYYQTQATQDRKISDNLKIQNHHLAMKNDTLENRVIQAENKANKFEKKFKELLGAVKDFVSKLEWIPVEIFNPFKKKMDELAYGQEETRKKVTKSKSLSR